MHNIQSNNLQSATVYTSGEEFPKHSNHIHRADRPLLGNMVRIYQTGFSEGKACFAIVNPRTWKVIASYASRYTGIPKDITIKGGKLNLVY